MYLMYTITNFGEFLIAAIWVVIAYFHIEWLKDSRGILNKIMIIVFFLIFLFTIVEHESFVKKQSKTEINDDDLLMLQHNSIINYDNNAVRLFTQLMKHPLLSLKS